MLKAKNWEFDDGRYYFGGGARFLPGKCILPKSLSIKEVVNADVEIDRNEYGSGLTESLAEAADVKQRAQILMQYLPAIREIIQRILHMFWKIYAAEDLRYRWKYFHSDAKP